MHPFARFAFTPLAVAGTFSANLSVPRPFLAALAVTGTGALAFALALGSFVLLADLADPAPVGCFRHELLAHAP